MPIDLSRLRKLEALPPSLQARGKSDDDRVVILLKLKEGEVRPSYVQLRMQLSEDILSAELKYRDLARLELDPAVESFSLSRAIPVID